MQEECRGNAGGMQEDRGEETMGRGRGIAGEICGGAMRGMGVANEAEKERDGGLVSGGVSVQVMRWRHLMIRRGGRGGRELQASRLEARTDGERMTGPLRWWCAVTTSRCGKAAREDDGRRTREDKLEVGGCSSRMEQREIRNVESGNGSDACSNGIDAALE